MQREREAMTALAHLPLAKIVRAIADAAERWSDADFPPRVRATEAIVARTGYSTPVVEYALDRIFFSMSERAIRATLASELGSCEAVDGFVARADRPDAWARPVGRVAVVSSRTTIGVALVPAVFALCAKCDVVVKDREDHLVRAFFDSLAEEREEFARAAVAQEWTHERTHETLRDFDAVVAFGGNDALASIRAATPAEARFIGFGPRASAGYIARETLADDEALEATLEGAARDAVLYESEGCLSLHALFVEDAGALAPAAVAERLAAAMERAAIEFPVGRRDAQTAAAVSSARNMAAFRAATARGAVYSDAAASFVLVLDPPDDEPPAFLPRTLGLRTVAHPAQALQYLRHHAIPLEGFALSSDRTDVVEMALEAGAVRLARFGELQQPPLSGEHGGRPRATDFIRWTTRTI